MAEDAIALIETAAQEPTLDELARRARSILALEAPSEEDMLVLVEFWRRSRATWGQKLEAKEEEE